MSSGARPLLHVVLTTLPDEDRALAVARGAVTKGLAACAQVEGPLRSIYSWRGAVEEGAEWRVTLKVVPERLAGLEAWVHGAHPYEVPQWVVLSAEASEKYLQWAHGS